MRVYRYKREKTVSYHSFGQYQIYVCYLSDTKGKLHPGVALLRSDSIIEVPYPLTESVAQSFSEFLKKTAGGVVPANFKFKGSYANMFATTSINFTKFKNNEIKARFFQGIFIFGHVVWATVNPTSLLACASSLRNLEW